MELTIDLLELIIKLLEQTNEAPSFACDPSCLDASLIHSVSFTESGVFELLELTVGAVLTKLLMLHVIQLRA